MFMCVFVSCGLFVFYDRQEKREKPDDLDSQSEALPLYVSLICCWGNKYKHFKNSYFKNSHSTTFFLATACKEIKEETPERLGQEEERSSPTEGGSTGRVQVGGGHTLPSLHQVHERG